MTYQQLIGIIIGTAGIGVSLWSAGYNCIALIQARRGVRTSSPILFIAPLFAFISGGILSNSLPQQPPFPLWLPGIVMLFIDPGSLPVILWLIFKDRKNDAA